MTESDRHPTATITLADRTVVQVLAQHTRTPGIVVTPELGGRGLSGFWQLTHATSGLVIPVNDYGGGVEFDVALRIGDALCQVPIDWTLDIADLGVAYNEDIQAKLKAVIRDAKYPPADPDAGTPAPGEYPPSAEQATAATMAASYTSTALFQWAAHWKLIGASLTDGPTRAVYMATLQTVLAEFATVHLLRAFAAADQQAADAAARDLWELFDAGDSIGDLLHGWATGYGIKPPTEDEVNAELAGRAGMVFPPPADYDTILDWALPHGEGTVRTLRNQIAKIAAKGQDRFGEITEQWIGKRGEPMDPGMLRDHMIAHGASFYGWSLVAILGWLATEYPAIARRAAAMVDDIGFNGGNEYCEDVSADPDPDPEPVPGADAGAEQKG